QDGGSSRRLPAGSGGPPPPAHGSGRCAPRVPRRGSENESIGRRGTRGSLAMRTQARGPAQELLEELGRLQEVIEGERGAEGKPVSFYYERAGQLLPLGQILPRGTEFVFLQGEDSDGEWLGVLG